MDNTNDKRVIYSVVRDMNKQNMFPTRKELAQYIRNTNPIEDSTVTGRVSDLLDDGHLVEVGMKACGRTGNPAQSLAVTTAATKHLAIARMKKKNKEKDPVKTTAEVFALELISFFDNKEISKEQKLQASKKFQYFIDTYISNDMPVPWHLVQERFNKIKGA